METNKTRGVRVRLIGSVAGIGSAAAPATGRVERATCPATGETGGLSSSVLKPAVDAIQQAPEIDMERVKALRDALAKGQLPFNAQRLAGLIEKFHKGHE